jgi:hypothetical protein
MMQVPAHMPPILPEVDIFNPQGYAAGGIVGGLENLGVMSKKMIDHLNNAVYGGASGASVNYSDSGMSSAPQNALGGGLFQFDPMQDQNTHSAMTAQSGPLPPSAVQPMREFGADGFASNIQKEMSPDSPYFNVPDRSQVQPLVGFNENNPYQMQPLGSSNANNQNLMLSQGVLGIPDATPLGQGTNMRSIFGFEDGGSVSSALADALSNDIGDYAVDDTMTDLSQTSYNDFDPGGNESFDAAAMDQFRNQQVSDLSNTIGQQIYSSIKSNQQMGTPAPVPQSVIEQMQFENLQNVPSTDPVFSMPNFNLGGMSTSFDLLGNPLTIGFKDGGSVPSTLPRSKRDAIAQKVAEMMAISAERVRAAQQNAEYNRLLRDQDAIDRQVALDRLKADQAESRQNMTLGSILSDIDYERRGLLRKEDGGSVPPRETDIRGQYHELSYITPDEADILMALGGSGEAGPMGIPAYRPGGDDGQGNVGGDAPGGGSSGGGSSGGGDEGEEGGGFSEADADQGFGFSGGNDNDDDPDDSGIEPGDFEANTNSPVGSNNDDDFSDSAEVAQDQQDMGFDVFDSIDDFNQQQQEQAKDRAIRDAFVTDKFGNPVGARSGYVTQGRATDATIAAGYQALGLPDPNSDLASADVEASYGVPTNAIESVSTGMPSTASKSGLLDFDYDLLTAEIAKGIQANKGIPTQVSPLATSPFNAQNQAAASAPIGLQDIQAIDELSFGPPAQSVSNVVSDFSPTPADQLADVYGIDLDALNAAVDDPNAAMGARGPTATDAKAGIGYDPVTDMPYGLEFATNPQTGAQITTNLAGLTEQQKANQPLSMDIAQFIGSNPYGYEIDPLTGNPIGQVGTAPFGILGGLSTLAQDFIMGNPQTTQDLIERGAYTGMTGQNNDDDIFGGDDDAALSNVLLPLPPEEEVPASTTLNQMLGMAASSAPTDPGPVLVPSTRTSAPFSGQMPVGYGTPQTGQINPYSLAEMKRYQQMLARLGQSKSPIGLANGGSVLDAAAGKFLESLTAA